MTALPSPSGCIPTISSRSSAWSEHNGSQDVQEGVDPTVTPRRTRSEAARLGKASDQRGGQARRGGARYHAIEPTAMARANAAVSTTEGVGIGRSVLPLRPSRRVEHL